MSHIQKCQNFTLKKGRKPDVRINICTPEKAMVLLETTLDTKIGDLKHQVIGHPRFFNYDASWVVDNDKKSQCNNLMSTKRLRTVSKRFDTKISSISGAHNQIKFDLFYDPIEKQSPYSEITPIYQTNC